MDIDPRRYSDRREVPKYTISEVALYLGLNPRTVHTWFFGRSYHVKGEPRFWSPLAIPADHNPRGPSLSFYNLAEAHVLSATRGFRISMRSIRHAMDNLVKIYPNSHPLISREFETDNRDIFIREMEGGNEEGLVNISSGNRAIKPILDAYLERIDRDARGWPVRVYPVRGAITENHKRIVIIPSVASGRPTIAGSGVRVESIWGRAQAGETAAELAEDYGIDKIAIEEAISYFANVKAA